MLVGKLLRKLQLGKPRRRREDNIKMDLGKQVMKMELAKGRVQFGRWY
jgi:hypothetical protein